MKKGIIVVIMVSMLAMLVNVDFLAEAMSSKVTASKNKGGVKLSYAIAKIKKLYHPESIYRVTKSGQEYKLLGKFDKQYYIFLLPYHEAAYLVHKKTGSVYLYYPEAKAPERESRDKQKTDVKK